MDYEDKESIICFIIITITLIAFVMSGKIVLIFCTVVLLPYYMLLAIEHFVIVSEYFKSIKK